MALLATLEGEAGTISLNDLFDVNDFLGVRYFGPEKWDQIKKCACIITSNAANNPTLFFLSNLKKDVPASSSNLGACLMGYNDVMGRRCMGAPAWAAVKNKINCELLGWNPISAVKDAASTAVSAVTTAAKAVTSAPKTALDFVNKNTFLKYSPVNKVFSTLVDAKDKYIDSPVKTAAQQVVDASSGVMYKVATETPLKYTGTGQIIKAVEEVREGGGVTSPGTANVYPSAAEVEAERKRQEEAAAAEAARIAAEEAEKKKQKAAAAARAWSSAQASANASIEQQKLKKQAAEAEAEAIAAQQEAEALQQNLQQTQETLSSKYAPWVLAGCGALLALAVLKK